LWLAGTATGAVVRIHKPSFLSAKFGEIVAWQIIAALTMFRAVYF
jgi:hypothetical protein